MRQKYILHDIEYLQKKVEELESILETCDGVISIRECRLRDYIVRTDYLGKLKDTNLKADFKSEIEKTCGDKFKSVCEKILNYWFIYKDEKRIINLLETFYDTLERYEYKQIVLDTYNK